MKDLILCRFEDKKVNIQYYNCPNQFQNCDKCPKLKSSLPVKQRQRPVRILKPNPNSKAKRDLFVGWDPILTGVVCGRDENGRVDIIEITWDFMDAQILDYLIYQYEEGYKKGGVEKGLEKFWWHFEGLLRWTQGDWECLTKEEKDILLKAKDGNVEAIQKLVIKNPEMIRIPFVADKLIKIVRQAKYGNGKEIIEAKKEWQDFLPKRNAHKNPVSDEHLMRILQTIMKLAKVNKQEASQMLLHYFKSEREKIQRMEKTNKIRASRMLDYDRCPPFNISPERLRKISVGIGRGKI